MQPDAGTSIPPTGRRSCFGEGLSRHHRDFTATVTGELR